MMDSVSKQHINCMSCFQVDLEHMVTGTVLTLVTVSIHFTHNNPSLDICSLSVLHVKTSVTKCQHRCRVLEDGASGQDC